MRWRVCAKPLVHLESLLCHPKEPENYSQIVDLPSCHPRGITVDRVAKVPSTSRTLKVEKMRCLHVHSRHTTTHGLHDTCLHKGNYQSPDTVPNGPDHQYPTWFPLISPNVHMGGRAAWVGNPTDGGSRSKNFQTTKIRAEGHIWRPMKLGTTRGSCFVPYATESEFAIKSLRSECLRHI